MAGSNGAVRTKSRPAPTKPRPAPAPAPVEDAAPVIPQPPAEEAPAPVDIVGIAQCAALTRICWCSTKAPAPVDIVGIAQALSQFPDEVRQAAAKLAAWEHLTVAIVDATLLLIDLTPAQRRRVADIAALLAE